MGGERSRARAGVGPEAGRGGARRRRDHAADQAGVFFALASAWAPGGDKIVFAADQQAWIAPSALWVMDADGDHLRKVPHAGAGWDPVWRPE